MTKQKTCRALTSAELDALAMASAIIDKLAGDPNWTARTLDTGSSVSMLDGYVVAEVSPRVYVPIKEHLRAELRTNKAVHVGLIIARHAGITSAARFLSEQRVPLQIALRALTWQDERMPA